MRKYSKDQTKEPEQRKGAQREKENLGDGKKEAERKAR